MTTTSNHHRTETVSAQHRVDSDLDIEVWVIDDAPSAACIERLGDARRLASAMGTHVAVLMFGTGSEVTQELIHHGADLVLHTDRSSGIGTKVRTTVEVLKAYQPRVVFAGGNPQAREWAALLAAGQDWLLVSPALIVDWRDGELVVTCLDHSGRRSCRVAAREDQTVVITMRPGVAEAWPAETSRRGELRKIELSVKDEQVAQSQILPADPATVDIRYANRLVAGGRGLGSKPGFDLLRRFAHALGGGVAASRMAVDLGWIDYERQVGQTGKTVQPDLYVACGISGASHHIDGMSLASHIIAINTDPEAPILKKAHLGIVGDLYPVLENALRRLES